MFDQMKLTGPTIVIVAVTIFAFILQQTFPLQAELFVLERGDLISAPYTLISHMFLHANFSHLLFNMFGVLIFGSLLERRLKDYQYYALYFISGLIAGIFGNFIYDAAVGASAGVMALVGASAFFFPKALFYILGVFPVQLRTLAIFYFVYDFVASFGINNVANGAHIVGMCAGLGFAYMINKNSNSIHPSRIKRVEAHMSSSRRNGPDKVVVLANRDSKRKNPQEDFSKKMYVSLDESNEYLNKNKE